MRARRQGHAQQRAQLRVHRRRLQIARLLRRAAGAVALDEKNFGALGAVARAIREFPRQAQLAGRALARHLALLAPTLALFGALGDAVEQYAACRRVGAEPMIEMVPQRGLDDARRLGGSEALLGLTLELRV